MNIDMQEERRAYLTVKNLLLQNFCGWWAIFCEGELSAFGLEIKFSALFIFIWRFPIDNKIRIWYQ